MYIDKQTAEQNAEDGLDNLRRQNYTEQGMIQSQSRAGQVLLMRIRYVFVEIRVDGIESTLDES